MRDPQRPNTGASQGDYAADLDPRRRLGSSSPLMNPRAGNAGVELTPATVPSSSSQPVPLPCREFPLCRETGNLSQRRQDLAFTGLSTPWSSTPVAQRQTTCMAPPHTHPRIHPWPQLKGGP